MSLCSLLCSFLSLSLSLSLSLVIIVFYFIMTLKLFIYGNRSFDESTWGAFDNNDDVDSVWGFNPNHTKVSQSFLKHMECVGHLTNNCNRNKS